MTENVDANTTVTAAAKPDDRDSLLGHADALRTIGRHDEAVDVYRRMIRDDPADAEPYWRLANLKNERFLPDEIEAMHQHLSFDHVTGETRAQFLFALGKACEDDADFTRAFRFYKEGNATRRPRERYNSRETRATFDRITRIFDAAVLARGTTTGHQSITPIFIVGVPHSGSTLIEQILATHGSVDGAGELAALDRLADSIDGPQALRDASADELQRLGAAYIEGTADARGAAPAFTDRCLTNFRHIGLIHLVLPDARIIDVRRHPLDSCLGAFKQLFDGGHAYSYDLAELGDYYLAYRQLMEHWHSNLPGRVHDLHYENLIADPEAEIRRLLDYCGLAWEEDCLKFYATDRPIRSPSSEQVRQPIYRDALQHWRHFESELGDLIAALRPVLDTLPSDQRPVSD